MSFCTLPFIFIFLPLFLLVCVLMPVVLRPFLLVCGSLIFIAIGDTGSMLFVAAFVLINYVIYRLILPNIISRKAAAAVVTLINIIPLFILKVCDDMPLGISFYVFSILSFAYDYIISENDFSKSRGRRREKKKNPQMADIAHYAAYILFFPKFLMGPITRYEDIREELLPKKISFESVEKGLKFFIFGMSLKILLADPLASLWSAVRAGGSEGMSCAVSWLGAVGFSMNLYFDFWGYCLMAMGIAFMFGISLPVNFYAPYFSKSISEFWRRWHITLGQWFRDYVYIPLGGSRGGKLKTVRNLFIVWLLTGIWHGWGLHFVLWGLFLFLFIALEHCTGFGRLLKKLPLIGNIYVLLLVPISWMIFALDDISELGLYLLRMIGIENSEYVSSGMFMRLFMQYLPFLIFGFIFITPLPAKVFNRFEKNPLMLIVLFVLFWVSVNGIMTGEQNPFMYLNF